MILLARGGGLGARRCADRHRIRYARLRASDHVWLCVKVPTISRWSVTPITDVGLHALTDALLGAIGAVSARIST
jgi:2C-methyl-D-erythritol 2,4-cyclodiphosphate synthase